VASLHFHSFKSQLTTQVLNSETGRVLWAYVQLYQNNMLMHLHAQQAQVKPPPSASAFMARAQPGHTPSTPPTAVITELHAELVALHCEFKAFCSKHEASSTHPPLSAAGYPFGAGPFPHIHLI